jgi:hypothetical protein
MSCVRANIPITIVEGGTFDKTFQWKTGTPPVEVDLTGYTANMQVRAKLKDTVSLLDAPFVEDDWVADGITGIYIPLLTTGTYRIYLKDEDTLGMCAAHKNIAGVYDLFLYNASGEAVLQQYGVATIIAAVTRNE